MQSTHLLRSLSNLLCYRHKIFVTIPKMSIIPLYWSTWIHPFKLFLDIIFLSRLYPSVTYVTEFPSNILWTFLISHAFHIPCKCHPFLTEHPAKVWCTIHCVTPNIEVWLHMISNLYKSDGRKIVPGIHIMSKLLQPPHNSKRRNDDLQEIPY